MRVTRIEKSLFVVAALAVSMLLASGVRGDNMPSPQRGHMGCSNTASAGRIPVGNGTGFCEQNPPRNVPLMMDTDGDFQSAVDAGGGKVAFGISPPDMPGDGAVYVITIPYGLTCASNYSGSFARANAASTGTATIALAKNGASVGSVEYATSASGTFSSSGTVSFSGGDKLRLTFPSPQNASLSGVGITFVCTKD